MKVCMISLTSGYWSGLGALRSLVGFHWDLGTPGLSKTELWILNKSMPSDWTPEPLANENHFLEISVLPLSPLLSLSVSRPLLCLYLSYCFYFRALKFLSPFALCPLDGAPLCNHTYNLTVFFCLFFVWFCFVTFYFPEDILRQPNVQPSSHTASARSVWRMHSRKHFSLRLPQ